MIRRLFVPLAAVLLFPPIALAQFDTKPTPAITAAAAPGELGKSETKRWEFGVIITAAGGPCAGLTGTAPVPQDWPEQQVKAVSEDITANVRGHSYRSQEGLKQLLFEIPQLAATEKATCLVTLEITKSQQLPPADPSKLVVPKNIPKDTRKALGPSPLIESTNVKFKTLAKELTDGKETAWAQVEALYDGVRERIKFQLENKDKMKGAIGALRDGMADKEDLTAAFVALCRVHKVPARMVWCFDNCDAEFYLEDTGGKGRWFPCELYGDKQFGTVKHFQPIIEKGDNFRVPEKKEPLRFAAEFLTGKGGGGSPTVDFCRRLVPGP